MTVEKLSEKIDSLVEKLSKVFAGMARIEEELNGLRQIDIHKQEEQERICNVNSNRLQELEKNVNELKIHGSYQKGKAWIFGTLIPLIVSFVFYKVMK